MFFLSRKPSLDDITRNNLDDEDHKFLPKVRNSKSENIVNPSLYAKAAMTRGKAAERMRMFDVALDELKKARETAERIGDWSTASKGMSPLLYGIVVQFKRTQEASFLALEPIHLRVDSLTQAKV